MQTLGEPIQVSAPNISIIVQMEKSAGSQELRNITKSQPTTNLTQGINWEGENQEGGYLWSDEKQQQIEKDTGLI